jgi:hypothetical protein
MIDYGESFKLCYDIVCGYESEFQEFFLIVTRVDLSQALQVHTQLGHGLQQKK